MSKEELQQTIAAARRKLSKIETAENYAEAKQLLGKCFKTRNNYSCPEKPSDYWWLYCRIIKVDKDADMRGFKFQTDKRGAIFIDPNEYVFRHMNGWQEISLAEYKQALSKLQDKIKKDATGALKLPDTTQIEGEAPSA